MLPALRTNSRAVVWSPAHQLAWWRLRVEPVNQHRLHKPLPRPKLSLICCRLGCASWFLCGPSCKSFLLRERGDSTNNPIMSGTLIYKPTENHCNIGTVKITLKPETFPFQHTQGSSSGVCLAWSIGPYREMLLMVLLHWKGKALLKSLLSVGESLWWQPLRSGLNFWFSVRSCWGLRRSGLFST